MGDHRDGIHHPCSVVPYLKQSVSTEEKECLQKTVLNDNWRMEKVWEEDYGVVLSS